MRNIGLTTSCLALALIASSWPATGLTEESAAAAPVPQSEMMPLAANASLILDLADAASRAVAVGERGEILVSESRTEWRQVADVPTRSTLTAVSAAGDGVWAVGHDGTIVASTDGGLTWTQQRRDVLDTANPSSDPRQGMPLLDVLMLSPQHGFAVGAYSQLLRTDDGGASWNFVATKLASDSAVDSGDGEAVGDEDNWTLSDEDLAMGDIAEPHFNAIARTGSGALMIVGERGTVLRSRDDGKTWESVKLPYAGSMFGVIGYAGDHVVAFGMRGNVFESRDLGEHWSTVETGTELSLMGGSGFGADGFALVGANGAVLLREEGAATAVLQIYSNAKQETPVLAGVLVRPNRSLVVSGDKGVDTFTPNRK